MSNQGHGASGSMRWLLTYADMITLLLAFFVIMYAISKVDAKKYQALAVSVRLALGGHAPKALESGSQGTEKTLPKSDPIFAIAEQLRASLGDEINGGRIQIERGADRILLRFQDTLFFERGKADLSSQARAILDKVARVVAPLPYRLEAEGHTDSLPIKSPQYPSNWELSVARSTAVVRYLAEEHQISPLRLAARGLGEHKPLYPNVPVLGEPRNRRVELSIMTGS